MQCQSFSYIGLDGQRVYKSKKAYDTQDEAITVAKRMNLSKKQLTKAVAYKCVNCGKYHVGRNGKLITPKYVERIKQNDY